MTEVARLNSIKDVVERTNLSRSTVYGEMDSGRLRSVKVGRRRLIPESALVDYIDNLVLAGALGTDGVELPADRRLNPAATPADGLAGLVTATMGAVVARNGNDARRVGAADAADPARMPR
jgi:excisionase family DNA binding protein